MSGPMGDAMNTIMASRLAKEQSTTASDRAATTAAVPRRARARAAVSAGWHWVRALGTAIVR